MYSSSHGGRGHQAGQDLREATQLPVYRERRGWVGCWRVLNAVGEGEKEGGRESDEA